MIKKEYKKICKRFDGVMWDIGCEYLALSDGKSEIFSDRHYYNVEKGVTLQWMADEAEYWLSCYYEPGHCRCEDRHEGKEEYKIWVSETGKLKRLIKAIEGYEDLDVCIEESGTINSMKKVD